MPDELHDVFFFVRHEDVHHLALLQTRREVSVGFTSLSQS